MNQRVNLFAFAMPAGALAMLTFTQVAVAEPTVGYNNSKILYQTQGIPENDLAATESNTLGRTYPNNPLSKRLQRLELLVFGTTQPGENNQRWQKLRDFLQNRNTANSGTRSLNSARHTATSLNELEKYLFKKHNPSIATAARLDKLETKLFGKASPNLGTERRIARLQRTLGFADTSGQMAELPNRGFRPGRGFEDYYFGQSPGMPRGQTPGMPRTFSFDFDSNDLADPELKQFESQMNQMMKNMQKQMQDQMRGYSLPPPGYNPKDMPEFSQPLIIPKQQEKLPSYNDPNFI
jgi:hypothetical protein